MGSILNFVFLKDTHEYNGDSSYAMQGPIFYYIQNKNYSYTINSEIKAGYKNVLLIEGIQKFKSIVNIPDSVYDFVKNNDIILLFTSIPDPCNIHSFINGFKYIKTKLPIEKYYLIDSN